MNLSEILSRCDHTLLLQTATPEEIIALCDEGIKYHTATVCIPPYYVSMAKKYVGNKLPICTVIGFPNGNVPTETKVFEAARAIADGADEIDMVINIGELKAKHYDEVYRDIEAVKKVCGKLCLKVIIETCLLTDEEKIMMCQIVTKVGADYIKTSTGFSKAGATVEDIELFRRNVGENVKIKAAGGIASIEDAERFLRLGAARLGTSRIVKIAKQMEEIK